MVWNTNTVVCTEAIGILKQSNAPTTCSASGLLPTANSTLKKLL